MGYGDYEVQSYEPGSPAPHNWPSHYVRHDEKKCISRMENLSRDYPSALFRVVFMRRDFSTGRVTTVYDERAYMYQGSDLSIDAAHLIIENRRDDFTRKTLGAYDVAQWHKTRPDGQAPGWYPRTVSNGQGEYMCITTRATIEAHRTNVYKSGLYEFVRGRDYIYILNGRYIMLDEMRSYTHEHMKADEARARWIMPPGGLDGLKHLGSCIQRSDMGGLQGYYTSLVKDLKIVTEGGNLTRAQKQTLLTVMAYTDAARGLLETLATSIGHEVKPGKGEG